MPQNPHPPIVGAEGMGRSAVSYWVPTRLVQSGWLEHGPFAFWIIEALRPSTYVELGTHNGYSFFTVCEAAARLGLDTRSFAVDSWEGDDHAGFYGEDIYADVVDVRDRLYPDAALRRGYFDDLVGTFEDGSIDLLHIDGRHGYDDVKHDFESWLPKLSSAAVVMFHDIAVHDAGFGVWQFWDELVARYPSFGFEHGNGLGVIGVGPAVPAALQPLFAATPQQASAVRAFYAERGATISRAYAEAAEVERLRAVEIGLNRELADLRGSTSWRLTAPLRAVSNRVRR